MQRKARANRYKDKHFCFFVRLCLNFILIFQNPKHFSAKRFQRCTENNGDCEQVCSSIPNGVRCSCFAGYKLKEDGLSCEGNEWKHVIAPFFGGLQSPQPPR